MIASILKSFLSLFISVGLMSLALFMIGLYWILSRNKNTNHFAMNENISPIAGDDVLSTQLDLARAYIETNHKHLAQPILQLVVEQGSKIQIAEAKSLLTLI